MNSNRAPFLLHSRASLCGHKNVFGRGDLGGRLCAEVVFMSAPSAEEWLEREDTVAREGRLARLEWIAAQIPEVDWMVFGCGPISKYVFEEARYCYVYGQFLASIMLGLAFVEMSLAGA